MSRALRHSQQPHDSSQSGVVKKDSLNLFAGRYLLQDRLGSGGFCEVHSAIDQETGREVAVKHLKPHMENAPNTKDFLHNEIAALCALRDPRIVSFVSTGFVGDVPYLVTERIHGETLNNVIPYLRGRVRTALKISSGICAAVDVLHSQSMIHRDVSLRNIFLTGEAPYIKLIDLGFVRYPGSIEPTQKGVILGKFRYMAPEVIQDKPLYSHKGDIYSMGVLMYMLLNDHKYPYQVPADPTPQHFVDAHLYQDPDPMPNSAIPLEVMYIVERAMDKDPEKRFASIKGMKAVIDWACSKLPQKQTYKISTGANS